MVVVRETERGRELRVFAKEKNKCAYAFFSLFLSFIFFIFIFLILFYYILYVQSPDIGRFSEAGLHEWMSFVIFRGRSRERSQRHFLADFWVGVASRCV